MANLVKASLSFLELVRGFGPGARESLNRRDHYCQICEKTTQHLNWDEGDWEVYRCQMCGNIQEYRVR